MWSLLVRPHNAESAVRASAGEIVEYFASAKGLFWVEDTCGRTGAYHKASKWFPNPSVRAVNGNNFCFDQDWPHKSRYISAAFVTEVQVEWCCAEIYMKPYG